MTYSEYEFFGVSTPGGPANKERKETMPQLHETRMGDALINHTLPRIATALERLAQMVEKHWNVDEYGPCPDLDDLAIRCKEEDDG